MTVNIPIQISALPSRPSQPVQAGVWNLGRNVFFDDFSDKSNIDLFKTLGTNFKWYLNNFTPFSGVSYPNADSTSFSISNSVLNVSTAPSPAFGGEVCTRGYVGPAPANPRTVGIGTFNPSNGLYVEGRMKFNLPPSDGNAPVFWMSDVNLMLAGIDQTAIHAGEIDIFEANSDRINQTAHNWTNWDTTDSEQRPSGGGYSTGIVSCPSQLDTTQFHRYGMLVIPTTMNGGTGFCAWYIDDALIGAANTWVISDSRAVLQSSDYVIFFAASPSAVAIQVDYIQVWTG